MAFDAYQVEHIREILQSKKVIFEEKKMMGGLCIMVDDKMLCGVLQDKETGGDLLMARVGTEFYHEALNKKGANPMDFTGRPLKGYIFVDATGFDNSEDLDFWISRCLEFNPLAKSSKKK